jgi:carbamoyl-phosphate synthase large subunit
MDLEEIFRITRIDRWFLSNIQEIISLEKEIIKSKDNVSRELLQQAKEFGFSDKQLAKIWDKKEEEVYALRETFKIEPAFKLVDTCAAEFQAYTPYFYSTYDK